MLYTALILITLSIMVITGIFLIKDKLSKLIISIYLIWWITWLSISMLNKYSLFPVSVSTYLLLFLSVAMFFTGFLVSGFLKPTNSNNINNSDINISKQLLFKVMLIIVTILLFYYWIRYRNLLKIMDPVNARLQRFTIGKLFSSAPEILFYNFFIEAFMIAVTIAFSYMVVYGKFKNIIFVFASLSLFLYSGIGSGRSILMDIAIEIVLMFLIRIIDNQKNNENNSISNKIKRINKSKLSNFLFIITILAILIIYSGWLTAQRMGASEFSFQAIFKGVNEFFKQGVIYYTGPFRALDYGLRMYPEKVGYLYGRGTFAGIDEIVNVAFRAINVEYLHSNEIIARLLQYNQVEIAPNMLFNFAYTNIMIFYLDFRILGVIFLSFLYGFFVRRAIFLYERRPMFPTLIIVTFLFTTMLNSVFKWGLQSPSSNILILVSYFCINYSSKLSSMVSLYSRKLSIKKGKRNSQ